MSAAHFALVVFMLVGCGGPAFTPIAPDTSASTATETATSTTDASPPGDTAASSTPETSTFPSMSEASSSDAPDASLDSSPDAESAYAMCVASFIRGCQSDPSACALVTVEAECGPPLDT
jgi:hypothetical protein